MLILKARHIVRLIGPESTDRLIAAAATSAVYGEAMEHVVVVGAGIGGLTASLILSRIAARVTLVERAMRPAGVGAALALQPNGMAVLDRLGLLAAVSAVSARIDRIDIRSGSGRMLMSAAMPDLGGGLDHAIAVRRTDLHRILVDAVCDVGSVDTMFGWHALRADPEGTVTMAAASEGGPDGRTRTLAADLVVGADGVSSIVRRTGGFDSRVSAGSSYVRTIVGGSANQWFEEYWTPLGSFGYAPLFGDATYFWAAAHVGATAEAVSRRDLPSFRQEWRRVLPVAAELLERVRSFDELLVNTVRRIDCPRWFSGRLVLLGDAAHAMAPNLGAGANSAMVDALILAKELVSAPAIPEAVAVYDRSRRPPVRRVQNMAGMLERICMFETPVPVGIRDALFVATNRVPHLSENMIRRSLAADIHIAGAFQP